MRAKATKTPHEDLDRLADLPDEEIDTSDIPETTPEQWRYARRPGRGQARVQPVAIEARIVNWFKAQHGDRYEEAINQALREHIRKVESKRAVS